MSLNDLLTSAKRGDESARDQLLHHLEPGLAALTSQYLPLSTEADRSRIISEAEDQIKFHIADIHSSPVGYTRAVLLNILCDELLHTSKKEDKYALNNLIALLRVRLKEDPQLSNQGWGAELDDDVLQESCLVLMEKLQDQVDSNPYLYFKQIVINKLRDKVRARSVAQKRFKDVDPQAETKGGQDEQSSQLEEEFVYEDPLDQNLEKRDLLDKIYRAMKSLPDFCREFFTALYQNVDEKIWRNIAREKWSMNESALNTRIHRCRHNLKALLEKRGIL